MRTKAEYDSLVQALTKVGVSLTDNNGELRSAYDILADISKIWDSLSANSQASPNMGLVKRGESGYESYRVDRGTSKCR